MPAKKKSESKSRKTSGSTTDKSKSLEDLRRWIRSIHSVNGKFRAQVVKVKEGGWVCQIWTRDDKGRDRPMIRNIKPFETAQEAVAMAQNCFSQFTGDDRYFADEDFWKWAEE